MHDFRKSMLNASICKCARFSLCYHHHTLQSLFLWYAIYYKSSSWAEPYLARDHRKLPWSGHLHSLPSCRGDLELSPPLNDESSPTQFLRKTVTRSRAICCHSHPISDELIWFCAWRWAPRCKGDFLDVEYLSLMATTVLWATWCQANLLFFPGFDIKL